MLPIFSARRAVLLTVLAALHAAPLAPTALAQTTTALPALADLDPAYARDLRDIIASLPFYEGAARATGNSLPDTYDREFVKAFAAQLNREEFISRVTPAWASFINPDLASRLAALKRLPVELKVAAKIKADPQRELDINEFTLAERYELDRIGNDPADKEFKALYKQVLEASRLALIAWRQEFANDLATRAYTAIAENEKAIATAVQAEAPETADVRTIGFAPWDQLIVASARYSSKLGTSLSHLTNTLDKTDYWQLLSPESVAERRNYAEAFSAQQKVELALGTTLAGMTRAKNEFEDELKNADLMKKPMVRAEFEPVIADASALIAKLRESFRDLFKAQRQLVTFMRGRDGKIRLAGDKLLYSDKRDEAMANKLLAQVDRFAAEVDAAFESYASDHDSGAPK